MRVLGIDPGLTRCGVGVVEGSVGRPLTLIDVNVLRTSATEPTAQRLVTIERGLDAWLDEFQPDAVAVERVFARSDSSTIIGTAQASGIALVVAARRDTIAPPASARALMDLVGSADKEYEELPGGHISLIAGRQANQYLWPKLVQWLRTRGDTPVRSREARNGTKAEVR